jgi:hypothetical protein
VDVACGFVGGGNDVGYLLSVAMFSSQALVGEVPSSKWIQRRCGNESSFTYLDGGNGPLRFTEVQIVAKHSAHQIKRLVPAVTVRGVEPVEAGHQFHICLAHGFAEGGHIHSAVRCTLRPKMTAVVGMQPRVPLVRPRCSLWGSDLEKINFEPVLGDDMTAMREIANDLVPDARRPKCSELHLPHRRHWWL